MYKLVLYGAGKRCIKLFGLLKQSSIELAAVIDSDCNKWGEEVEGYLIESPDRILELKEAYVCITIGNENIRKEVRRDLQNKYQYDLTKEISSNRLILDLYESNEKMKQNILSKNVESNRKESILFDCLNGFILGGIEEWTIGICDALIKSGKENIYVIARQGVYTIPEVLENHMVCVDRDSCESFSIKAVWDLVEVIVNKLPCKVITTQPDDMLIAAYLIKCCYPDLIEIISTIRAGGTEWVYERYLDFRKCTDVYIGVSQDIREDMVQRGVRPEKVLLMSVPFACEEEINRTYTEERLVPIRIGYAGRMENAQKRMDLLLQLLAELEAKKVIYKMELAGDGVMREEMEEFVTANQLTNKVEFLGRIPRSEIPAFWKRQDICVNIADFEGRSHSIIEAMGNGAVPVVTATSGVREDITDDLNGYIVPLRDYHTMAEKIEYLAEHRERLAEMGKLAHDAVYPKSRMENHLKFWEDVFSHKVW